MDCHADTHHAAALDDRGRLLGTAEFAADSTGYGGLAAWLRQQGRVRRVGVEGSGAYGAGLARYLQACGIAVVEVNRPHSHTRAHRGKTDRIDAEAAARKVLAGECTAVPKDTTGVVESIRQLHVVRSSAVKSRTAAFNQFDKLLVTAPAAVRESLTARSLAGKTGQAAAWRPDLTALHQPVLAAKYALRSLARRIAELTNEINETERTIAALVERSAPRTLALLGLGPIHTAQMLVTAGQNIDRLRGETAFAHLCAADPIPASSGKTTRHRLNPYGKPRREPHPPRDRGRPTPLLPTHPRLPRPTHRRRTVQEGHHALPQRYIAREIYYALRADLKELALTT